MRIVRFANGETTTGAKATTQIVGSVREQYTCQIIGTGTFDVDVEGSFDGTNWSSVAIDKTASAIFQIDAVPYIRLNCVTMTGANVTAYVGV